MCYNSYRLCGSLRTSALWFLVFVVLLNIGSYSYSDDMYGQSGFPTQDVNQDGWVDYSDLLIVIQHLGQGIAISSGPNPDVNYDGKVDILDVIIVASHFGDVDAVDDHSATQAGLRVLKHWEFNESEGWIYGGNEIIDPRIEDGILEFTSSGSDPIMDGPEYEPIPASNRQAIEIKLRSNSSGIWQLFYSNTNEGLYGGYSEEWSTHFHISASTDWQIVRVCPFWEALSNTIKIRLDPANGHYQVDWIRIVEVDAVDDHSAIQAGLRVLKHWEFSEMGCDSLEGWICGGNEIIDSRIENGVLEFISAGSDPIMDGPEYEPIPASNRQAAEIKLRSNSSGIWQLFYSSTNGGYSEEWSTFFYMSASTDWQIVRVCPFWEALGNTIKIRLDPPHGHYQIDWIRIVEIESPLPSVSWRSSLWWPYSNMKSLLVDEDILMANADMEEGVFLAFTDFDSALDNVLYLRWATKGTDNLAFCWANDVSPGLHRSYIATSSDGLMHTTDLDLSSFREWRGQIDAVGFIFGQKEGDALELGDFMISDSPQGPPEVELALLLGEPAIRRQGQTMFLLAYLRNSGVKTFPGGEASLVISDDWEAPGTNAQSIPALGFNERAFVKWELRPNVLGTLPIKIYINGRVLSGSMRVEPAINVSRADYVPEPRPVDTDPYEIGVYYYPGWSPDRWYERWEKQAGFPERDPALGFYREGDPEVADWHIKWAVENGISFFVYDWYWRDGHIDHEKALEDGYLNAKYRDYLKFYVMWANHAGFADHSLDQLLTVTDYWLENYFWRECYYKIDGKPVVSFFAPDSLTNDLDSSQNVRAAFDAMRKRVQEAGMPGIYFIACGDNSPDGQRHFKSEGYDAVSAYNYPWAGATSQRSPYSALMDGHIPIWNEALEEQIIPYIPLLTVGWDSRPWHGEDALVRFGRTTESFKEGLMSMKEWMDDNGVKVGLLECWNEWGEGSYIEPNREFGFGDLEAIRSVFAKPDNWPQNIAPSDVGLGPYHIDELDHGLPD